MSISNYALFSLEGRAFSLIVGTTLRIVISTGRVSAVVIAVSIVVIVFRFWLRLRFRLGIFQSMLLLRDSLFCISFWLLHRGRGLLGRNLTKVAKILCTLLKQEVNGMLLVFVAGKVSLYDALSTKAEAFDALDCLQFIRSHLKDATAICSPCDPGTTAGLLLRCGLLPLTRHSDGLAALGGSTSSRNSKLASQNQIHKELRILLNCSVQVRRLRLQHLHEFLVELRVLHHSLT